jgi:D-alanyl-D-alanine carboxypeptidase
MHAVADTAAVRDAVKYADQWLDFRRELRDVPGMVVAVRHDREVLLSKGYGFAELDNSVPLSPRHVFRIASHSKMFTATAIMQLVERGRLRLDDRASMHIPWLTAEPTLRQLLNHAGGIVRDGAEADYWLTQASFPDHAQLRAILEHGAVFDTNQTFKYSNIGYGLLGLVVEAVADSTYNQYVKQHIVDRLGLADTGPEVHAGVTEHLVTGYSPSRLGVPRRPVALVVDTHALSPATGFYSTAEDLCRFAAAHWFGDTTLLTDASKREMQQPYWAIEQADENYGLGFSVKQIGSRRLIGHGGGFPGQSTRTLFDPADRLVVVVLTNTGAQTAAPGPIAETIVKIIDFALDKARSGQLAPPPLPLEPFTGRFLNLWGVTDVACFGNSLVAINPEQDDPVQHVTELEVVDPDTLRITRTGGYASPGEFFRYDRAPNGAPTRLVAGGLSRYPPAIFRERYT